MPALITALCTTLAAVAAAGLLPATMPAAQARPAHPYHQPAPAYPSNYAAILINAHTGAVLDGVNADEPHPPASLAKLMTLYLTFEALRDRRITLDELVPVSEHAASMQPTKLGLEPGMRITVREAILGMVTRSANDAAVALGELLGGTEPHFAQMMTLRAHALGMSHTVFANASGLPNPPQWTTARDMATLARHLQTDFPSDYGYFSTPSFVFRHQVIYNHDTMLKNYPGVDGMKTGFTNAAGHNLVTSAKHGDVRLIGVVLGATSNWQRDKRMTAMLNIGFADTEGGPAAPHDLANTEVAARTIPAIFSTAHAATLPVNRDEDATSFAQVQREIAHARAERTEARVPTGGPARWGVQAGVFGSEAAAHHAAALARDAAGSGTEHVTAYRVRGRKLYRTQLLGLTHSEAANTCADFARHHNACLVLRPDMSQVASR